MGGNVIQIVDAKTLQYITRTIDDETMNLTALVFDAQTRKLYATDRNTNLLHVIGWNPAQKAVSLERTIELENIDYACGLVIEGDLLYVSEFYYSTGTYYSDVNCYRISEDFAFVETIDMGDKVVAIDYEADENILYGGAYAYTTYQHLIKNDLDDPNGIIQKKLGAGVIGVACDPETSGRVFLTTYRNHGIQGKENYGSLEMWDTADWQAEPNTLPITEVTAIYDDLNTDGTNMASLSGLVVANTSKPPIQVVKRDDVETCISPESEDPNFVYTIGVSDPNGHTNLWIVDYLPREVEFVSASPADPNNVYDLETHTYTWFVPSIDGYDPGDPNSDPNTYFSLMVRANEWAKPLGRFTNIATAESATPRAVEDTGYISFGGIEARWATGRNTGTSWDDAYRTLTEALERAGQEEECANTIWVAQETYRPSDTVLTETFKIPAGVSVYGGFKGDETSRDQRNILKYPTLLSGYIDETSRENTVVTMNGNGALLDGFTVQEGNWQGIDGSGVSSTVVNCVITDSTQRGLFCENGNLTVQWCEIYSNGIHHQGSGYSLTVENCKIYDNQYDGILTDQSTLSIVNSLVYQNGSTGSYYGIHLGNPSSSPTIRNNTIVQNINEGIRFVGSNTPDIVNCIVYYNGGDVPLAGLNPDAVAYNCCIEDCNELNTTNINDEPGFAYTTEPNNMPVVGNYHLAYNSPCIDTGDSDEYTDEVDMDGELRGYGDWVDRGADEAYSCDEDLTEDDVFNPLDWNADGLVNLEEFTVFSSAWLTEDPNIYFNPLCDLDTDDNVDLADLLIFSAPNNWLWQACWRTDLQAQQMQMMMAPQDSEEMLLMESTLKTSVPVQVIEEQSITEQIIDLAECVRFLEKIWLEEPDIRQEISEEDWKKFMDADITK
jgi:parallel beta-helix repeat protein